MAQVSISVTATNGSAVVTLSDTAGINPGSYFKRSNEGVPGAYPTVYEVLSVVTDTSVTLTGNYGGVTSSFTGVFHNDFSTNHGWPLIYTGDIDVPDILRRFIVNLDASVAMNNAALTVPTIDTGQGPVECYAMDQAVRTTDNVTFDIVLSNLDAVTNPANPATFGYRLQNSSVDSLGIGSDASYAYLQSWASKPLYINQQGNDVVVGGAVTVEDSNINLSNTYALTGRNNADTLDLAMIRRNTSDVVEIDPDGYGTSFTGAVTVALGGSSFGASATTANIMTVNGAALTTGTGLLVDSNSADTSARDLVFIRNDNALATGARCLNIQQDSTADAIRVNTDEFVVGAGTVLATTTGNGTTAFSNTTLSVMSDASGRDSHIKWGDNTNASAVIGYLSGDMYFWTNGAERMRVDTSGTIATGGETAPDVDAGGICINHGANDGNALTLKNSDVAHGVTNDAETDTYARFKKITNNEGGLEIWGLSELNVGIRHAPVATAINTSDTAFGVYDIYGLKKSGTGTTGLADGENLTTFSNNGTVNVVIKGNGDIVTQGGITVNDVVKLKSYTVATVPTAVAGGFIYVSDETGGAVTAFSDGTNWRRTQDRAVVA